VSPRLSAAFRQTFTSARGSRNFRLYLSGHVVSAVGTWMNFTSRITMGRGSASRSERTTLPDSASTTSALPSMTRRSARLTA